MPKAYTWSKLLDDLYHMKIESDKSEVEKPLLGPFIKCVQEQQLSLAVENAKPTNFELVFGYCVANLSVIREKQIQHEKAQNLQEADSLNHSELRNAKLTVKFGQSKHALDEPNLVIRLQIVTINTQRDVTFKKTFYTN